MTTQKSKIDDTYLKVNKETNKICHKNNSLLDKTDINPITDKTYVSNTVQNSILHNIHFEGENQTFRDEKENEKNFNFNIFNNNNLEENIVNLNDNINNNIHIKIEKQNSNKFNNTDSTFIYDNNYNNKNNKINEKEINTNLKIMNNTEDTLKTDSYENDIELEEFIYENKNHINKLEKSNNYSNYKLVNDKSVPKIENYVYNYKPEDIYETDKKLLNTGQKYKILKINKIEEDITNDKYIDELINKEDLKLKNYIYKNNYNISKNCPKSALNEIRSNQIENICENTNKEKTNYFLKNEIPNKIDSKENEFKNYDLSKLGKNSKSIMLNPYSKFLEDTLEKNMNFNEFDSRQYNEAPKKRDETQQMLLNNMKNIINDIQDRKKDKTSKKTEKKQMIINNLENRLKKNSKNNIEGKNINYFDPKINYNIINNNNFEKNSDNLQTYINYSSNRSENYENRFIEAKTNENISNTSLNKISYVINNTKEKFSDLNNFQSKNQIFNDKDFNYKNEINKIFKSNNNTRQNKNDILQNSINKDNEQYDDLFSNEKINNDFFSYPKSPLINKFHDNVIKDSFQNQENEKDNTNSCSNSEIIQDDYYEENNFPKKNCIDIQNLSKKKKKFDSHIKNPELYDEEEFINDNIDKINLDIQDNLSDNELSSIHQSLKEEDKKLNIFNPNIENEKNLVNTEFNLNKCLTIKNSDFKEFNKGNKNNFKENEKNVSKFSVSKMCNDNKINKINEKFILNDDSNSNNRNLKSNPGIINPQFKNDVLLDKGILNNKYNKFENLPEELKIRENIVKIDFDVTPQNNLKESEIDFKAKNMFNHQLSSSNEDYYKIDSYEKFKNNNFLLEKDKGNNENLPILNLDYKEFDTSPDNYLIDNCNENNNKKSNMKNKNYDNSSKIYDKLRKNRQENLNMIDNIEKTQNYEYENNNKYFINNENKFDSIEKNNNEINDFQMDAKDNDINDENENKINRFSLDYDIIGSDIGKDKKYIQYDNLELRNKEKKYQEGEDSNDLSKYKNQVIEFLNYNNEEE